MFPQDKVMNMVTIDAPHSYTPLTSKRAKQVTFDPIPVSCDEVVTLKVNVGLSEGLKLHNEQDSMWQVIPSEIYMLQHCNNNMFHMSIFY